MAILKVGQNEVYVATICQAGVLKFWIHDGKLKEIAKLLFCRTLLESVAMSLIGNKHLIIAIGGYDKHIHIYAYERGSASKLHYQLSMPGHMDSVKSLVFTSGYEIEGAEESFYLASGS